jgi:hypothetical protein
MTREYARPARVAVNGSELGMVDRAEFYVVPSGRVELMLRSAVPRAGVEFDADKAFGKKLRVVHTLEGRTHVADCQLVSVCYETDVAESVKQVVRMAGRLVEPPA